MKRFRILFIGILILALVGCGSSNNEAKNAMSDMDYDYNEATEETASFGGVENDVAYEMETEDQSMDKADFDEQSNDEARKIIKSASMDLETLEFDKATKLLTEKVKTIGGYIEQSSIQGKSIDDQYSSRYANYTLRIPEAHFLTFMADLNTVGHIIYENTYGEDITSQYYDTEARLNTLEIQEERLLNILMKAEEIEDIIALERELSNVRYQIESFQGSIKRWDSLVSYATLHLSIREVVEITEIKETPKTLGEKIADSFSDSIKGIKRFFENLVVFLIGSIPYLIIYIPVIVILVIILKKLLKRRKFQVSAPEEKKDE